MSSNYAYANLAIGCKLSAQELFPVVRLNHKFCSKQDSYGKVVWRFSPKALNPKCPDPIRTKFCPECGAPAYHEVNKLIDGLVLDNGVISGLKVVQCERPAHDPMCTLDSSDNEFYIDDSMILSPPEAVFQVHDDCYNSETSMIIKNLESIQQKALEKCKQVLEPVDLFKNFGTYLVARI